MSPSRSILAVLGGFVVFQVLTQLLELTLVAVVAVGPPADEAAYLAVRNRPGVLVARVGAAFAAGLLAGYMAGKVAGTHEWRHALGAGALVTGQLLMEFGTEFAPPVWTRVALLATATPSMVLGAWVRASAAAADPDVSPARSADQPAARQ
jgi:hypothetical protein